MMQTRERSWRRCALLRAWLPPRAASASARPPAHHSFAAVENLQHGAPLQRIHKKSDLHVSVFTLPVYAQPRMRCTTCTSQWLRTTPCKCAISSALGPPRCAVAPSSACCSCLRATSQRRSSASASASSRVRSCADSLHALARHPCSRTASVATRCPVSAVWHDANQKLRNSVASAYFREQVVCYAPCLHGRCHNGRMLGGTLLQCTAPSFKLSNVLTC